MRNRIRKRGVRTGERGQALVEFAIIIPILLAVLLGIVEFARAWQIQQVVTNSAREAARFAVLPSTPGGAVGIAKVDSVAQDYMRSANMDMGYYSSTIVNSITSGDPDTVTVSYAYTYTLFGPVMNLLGGGSTPGSVNLSSTSIMRNE